MKVLEALIKAHGWQGGTIHEAVSLIPYDTINHSAYSYGLREGKALRHGTDVSAYPVPVNSWDSDKTCTFSYVLGILNGLEQRQEGLV